MASMHRMVGVCALVLAGLGTSVSARQGSVFLTGHDPDFHAILGGNALGAQHINQVAINFILDPAYNPFAAGGTTKLLFVNSNISPPGGHTDGEAGIIASGYVTGIDYEEHDASTLNGELDLLGTKYGGIVVASDFGGILTQAELDILNARSQSIFDFVNAGGGIYAMAEGNNGAGLTPNGGWFDFVPVARDADNLNQSEIGFTVTPFGASLGLVDADVNGNASHNIFVNWQAQLQPVDMDSEGHVLSLAGRLDIPAPGAGVLVAMAVAGAARRRSRR